MAAVGELWTDRFFAAIRVSPLWIGAALAGLLLVVFLVLVAVTGQFAEFMAGEARWWEVRDARLAVVLAVVGAYLPIARRYARLSTRRNVADLRSLMGWDAEELAASQRELLRPDRGAARLAGSLGLLLVPVSGLLIDRDPSLYFQSAYWRPVQIWIWGVGALVAWNFGVLAYELVTHARRFSALAERMPEIDLLDLGPLSPFARQGLHSALPWLILLSFYALNAVDRGFLWAIAVMGSLALAGATAALLLPMGGIRRRILEAKRCELARVNAAIRGDRAALSASAIERRAGTVGLGDLLAYRAFVAALPAWPFDTPTRVRFVLYVALPVGSWLGGAFVERVLEAALA